MPDNALVEVIIALDGSIPALKCSFHRHIMLAVIFTISCLPSYPSATTERIAARLVSEYAVMAFRMHFCFGSAIKNALSCTQEGPLLIGVETDLRH